VVSEEESRLFLNIKDKTKLKNYIDFLRVDCANNKRKKSVDLILEAIRFSEEIGDNISLVNLCELQIKQILHKCKNLPQVRNILKKMKLLAEEANYTDGLALYFQIKSHVEYIEGNIENSSKFIRKSVNLLEDYSDPYVCNICNYSYAIEIWMTNHSIESVNILEKCAVYFYKEGFYRSLVQTFGMLGIIYSRLNENKKALDLSNQILANRYLFENLPIDVKGIVYYFAGWANILSGNLKMAECHFSESDSIFKPIHKNSIYFSNYLTLQSYFATAQALQGKIVQSSSIVKDAYNLLQSDYFIANLDQTTAKQVNHNLNLVRFYIVSRLGKFNPEEHRGVIDEILESIKELLSDFMSLSEFILNADLNFNSLQELLTIDNFSINRVKHLIKYMIEQQKPKTEIDKKQKILNCISILNNREVTTKTTFMEHAYVDLLIAQELFSLKRYAEIVPLLKKYENRLNQIEVLEMRIFMEAFIQVGAFKNGDPLGPALQYMAIKKCRNHCFSRLEKTLLNYLQLQQRDITKSV